MLMLCAESWAFQVLSFIAGLISVNDQAAYTLMVGIGYLMFMVPLGIQSASAAIIGESIGAF